MRICDLNTGLTKLKRSFRKLQERWEDTQTYWNDSASRDFLDDHLQPIAPLLTLTTAAVYRIAEVFEQAEKELEDVRPPE